MLLLIPAYLCLYTATVTTAVTHRSRGVGIIVLVSELAVFLMNVDPLM
jgi:hypothetical protein